jgi:hypothetical protein
MAGFFETIYEGFPPLRLFYITDFSDAMFDAGAYTAIGLIMLLSSLAMIALYYYLLSNYGSLNRRGYWLLWILVIAVVNFTAAYLSSMSALEAYDPVTVYPASKYFSFSMVNVLWAVVFSFLFSLVLKTRSVSASRTPF